MKIKEYEKWLTQHLADAEKEYNRLQKIEEEGDPDEELYEKVHQLWGYVAGVEKCLRQLKTGS